MTLNFCGCGRDVAHCRFVVGYRQQLRVEMSSQKLVDTCSTQLASTCYMLVSWLLSLTGRRQVEDELPDHRKLPRTQLHWNTLDADG
jgi:hypothetical protein